MNNVRRSRLRDALKLLSQAESIISDVSDAEDEALSNCPENLQASECCAKMEDAVDSLNDAIQSLDDAQESIRAAIV